MGQCGCGDNFRAFLFRFPSQRFARDETVVEERVEIILYPEECKECGAHSMLAIRRLQPREVIDESFYERVEDLSNVSVVVYLQEEE